MRLKALLFHIAKSPFMGASVGNAFRFLPWAIPVKKVFCSRETLAFHHPQPCYKNHLILSPRKAIKNLLCLAADSAYFEAIFQAALHLSATLPQYGDAFTLVANGGKKQEVQQVHFHMFTNYAMVNAFTALEPSEHSLCPDEDICVFPHPNPNWAFHFIIQPSTDHPQDYFKSVLQCIDRLNAEYDIVSKGYSLVYQHTANTADILPVFHIVSGEKLH